MRQGRRSPRSQLSVVRESLHPRLEVWDGDSGSGARSLIPLGARWRERVHGGDARFEQFRRLRRLLLKHIDQEQDGPLLWGQILQCGDEGESDALPQRRLRLGSPCGVIREIEQRIGRRFNPDPLLGCPGGVSGRAAVASI
jgi:hypothetical protein